MQPFQTYSQLFESFCTYLPAQDLPETNAVTRSIKAFFQQEFQSPHAVLCSHEKGSEFMLDVLVTSFSPKTIVAQKTLKLLTSGITIHLAAESELGGVSASSPYGVMRNVIEDYLKLLVVNAKYRVMIFTSLPYAREDKHLANRIETLRELYLLAPGLSSGVLLIHLDGSQLKSSQVRVSTDRSAIRGFVISDDGSSVDEIFPAAQLVSAAA